MFENGSTVLISSLYSKVCIRVTDLKQSIYIWAVYMDIDNNMNCIYHRYFCTEFVCSTEMEYFFYFDKLFRF